MVLESRHGITRLGKHSVCTIAELVIPSITIFIKRGAKHELLENYQLI